jgi:hypothetical protein
VDREPGGVRAYAQRSFGRNAIEILLTYEGPLYRDIAQPVVFKRSEEDGAYVDPTLRLREDEAQGLMDALWHAGLRPSEGTGSAGAMAATERHLADMREIVKKQGIL